MESITRGFYINFIMFFTNIVYQLTAPAQTD